MGPQQYGTVNSYYAITENLIISIIKGHLNIPGKVSTGSLTWGR